MSRRVVALVSAKLVESLEQSEFVVVAEAVIDVDLRLDVLHRLAVAAIQDTIRRGDTCGGRRGRVLHYLYQRIERGHRVLARDIANVGDLFGGA